VTSGRIPAPSYRKVYAEGRSVSNRLLVLYYLADPTGMKMGVSVPGRLGKATVRNKLRRRVKEAFRRFPPDAVSGQFVFIVRRGATGAAFQDLVDSMRGLFKRMATVW